MPALDDRLQFLAFGIGLGVAIATSFAVYAELVDREADYRIAHEVRRRLRDKDDHVGTTDC